MKKIFVSMSLLVLILSITCSAFAWQTPIGASWFNLNSVQCVNSTTLKYVDLENYSEHIYPYKSMFQNFYGLPQKVNTQGRIYVYHTVSGGGGNAYTSMIHAVRYDSNTEYLLGNASLCGSKWVTPSQWIPIQNTNSAIPDDRIYSVAVRGNTKHYENHGATSLNFHIGIEPNQ